MDLPKWLLSISCVNRRFHISLSRLHRMTDVPVKIPWCYIILSVVENFPDNHHDVAGLVWDVCQPVETVVMHSDLPQVSSNLTRTSRLVRQIQIRLLTLRAWVPVTRQQEHPQVSVNRCGRHVIHCAEHRITYLARADFIVKYGQTETRCCALSYGTSSSHQLDNLSFVLDYFR